MMEKLLTPADVAGILQVSKRTAYTLMQGMQRIERPLRVTENSLRDWINERAVSPKAKKPGRKRQIVIEWKVERR